LGCPQQAFGIFVRCAAQNTMLAIFPAPMRIFACGNFFIRRLSLFQQRISSLCEVFSPPLCRRLFFLTLLRDTLISADGFILIYLSTVIAQLWRQSGENIS